MKFPAGVKPWKYDPSEKGFSHTRFYGAANISDLPEGLKRPLRLIEDQQYTLRCGAYSSAVSNGYMRSLRFHPDWQAKPISEIQKKPVDD